MIFLGLGIAFTAVLWVIVPGILGAAHAGFWSYAFLLLYPLIVGLTFLCLFDNKAVVIAAVGLVLAAVIVPRTSIVSFTRVEVVDNDVFEDWVELSEQKDGEYYPLTDGRLFRIVDRYAYGVGEILPPGTRLRIDDAPLARDGRAVFKLFGIGKSREFVDFERDGVRPLITVPLRTVRIARNVETSIGVVELLGARWQPDDFTLRRALNSNCCDPAWIDELIKRGADARQIDRHSKSNLFHLLAAGKRYGSEVEAAVRLLAGAGVDMDARSTLGRSAFHSAVVTVMGEAHRQERMTDAQRSFLQLMLELGADPNTQDNNGRTPLHATLPTRFYDLSRLLLRHGADPAIENNKGESALERAIHYRDSRHVVLTDEQRKDLRRLVDEMHEAARTAGSGRRTPPRG